MEPRLVYRALRKISDWTLDHFYSDVLVDTSNLSPEDASCPMILVSSHHNEIIDIATLAVTIPKRRFVSYWAKASMFRNLISRQVLESAASIPVERNPDRALQDSGTKSNANLFLYTCHALAAGNVIGVFPEGTSYTQPRIMQVKEGAAWAAIEYMRWSKNRKGGKVVGKPLLIVPVGIVYTDKSRYRSRVIVTYGKPIVSTQYEDRLADGTEEVKKLVKQITQEISDRLHQLTINAQNWESLYAAKLAVDDIANVGKLGLPYYISEIQNAVDEFNQSTPKRASLLRYFSLLHYSGISHVQLTELFQDPKMQLTVGPALKVLVKTFFGLVAHPRFVFFVPALVTYLPGYLLGSLAARILGNKDEEEGLAQYKAIFGGVGVGLGFAMLTRTTMRILLSGHELGILQKLGVFGGTFYTIAWIMSRWHDTFVDKNYEMWKRFKTSCKVLASLLLSGGNGNYEDFEKLPPPPRNPFIKSDNADTQACSVKTDRVPTYALVKRVYEARKEALDALQA